MKTEEYHDALKDALKSVQKVRLIVGANLLLTRDVEKIYDALRWLEIQSRPSPFDPLEVIAAQSHNHEVPLELD